MGYSPISPLGASQQIFHNKKNYPHRVQHRYPSPRFFMGSKAFPAQSFKLALPFVAPSLPVPIRVGALGDQLAADTAHAARARRVGGAGGAWEAGLQGRLAHGLGDGALRQLALQEARAGRRANTGAQSGKPKEHPFSVAKRTGRGETIFMDLLSYKYLFA